MTTVTLILLVLAFMSATATRPKRWNSRMYPLWKNGDQRFRTCWSGGDITFDLKNDGPTLTGAKTTFSIILNFPQNQKVNSDGQVVWARNCTINGVQYQEGQAVYPDQDEEQTGVFPDGTPFNSSQNKETKFIYVWKTCGRYWQVADGPSSSLTIDTDNIPLGSYDMEVAVYHCRGKDKFIPLGRASTVYAITDQVPFSMSLAQVDDVNQNDQNFIQNRAIAFTIKLHDPSRYLCNADITFSWDFGDSSGTLISRDLTVTHTYLTVGTFRPQVVLMASIPNDCANPTTVAPPDASSAPAVVVIGSTSAAASAMPAVEGDALDVPAPDATLLAASVQPAEAAVNTDAEAVEVANVTPEVVNAAFAQEEQDPATDADAAAGEVATAASVAPAAEEAADAETTDAAEENIPLVDAAASVAPVVEGEEAAAEVTDNVTVELAAEGEEAAAEVTENVTVELAAEEEAAAEVTDNVTVELAAEEEAAAEVTDNVTVELAAEEEAAAAAANAAVDAAAEVVQAVTELPLDNVVAPAAIEATTVDEAAPADAAADTVAEAQATENEAAATAAPAEQPAADEAEVETDPAEVPLVVVRRQAQELTPNCMIYRYGTLATTLEVIQGIESVEIVEMSNVESVATEMNQNVVDVTISCQGSLPSEVCTVISDADCITPMETVCAAATPSPDCQIVLRQFFNDSGVFCINVSLTNDVSIAATSARVSVSVGSSGSPGGTAAIVLGVMFLSCVVCCVGLMYRRFKQYQPLGLDSDDTNGGRPAVTSVPLLLWNLLSRQSPGESRPLLHGRVV